MRPLSWMPALLVLVACAAKPVEEKPVPLNTPSAATQVDPPSRAKASIGDFGLDLTAGKPEVKPGDDFVAFAGDWYDHFEIPADRQLRCVQPAG